MTTHRIALYARVSSERQAQLATIESQLCALRERARLDGCVLLPTDEYVDNGCSGSTLRRPALERLRDRLAAGEIDTIYVYTPDRLARRYAHQVLLLDEFASRGARTVILQGRNGVSAEDELLTQVQGVIAEYERAKIMERSRRGKLHKARNGSAGVLSCAPYGYTRMRSSDGGPVQYQIVLHEAQVVRRIFHAAVHEHLSLNAIASVLNEEGVPPRGRPRYGVETHRWHASSIHQVLCNPTYMGEAAYGKTEAIIARPTLRQIKGRGLMPKRANSGARPQAPEKWIRIPVPPIVSREIFEAAKDQLARNRDLAQRNGKGNTYLLSGLCVCARCRYGYYGRANSPCGKYAGRDYSYYFCAASTMRHVVNSVRCTNRSVRRDLLEDHVWRSVCDLLKNPSRMMDEWTRRTDASQVTSEYTRQYDEALRWVRSHEKALQRLLDAYEIGAIELADLKTRSELVRERLTRARNELDSLEKHFAEQRELQLVIAHVESFAERLRVGLDTLGWKERQAVVRAVVARIEIDADDVTIVYRVPDIVGMNTSEGPLPPPTIGHSPVNDVSPSSEGSNDSPAGSRPRSDPHRPFVDCIQGVNTP